MLIESLIFEEGPFLQYLNSFSHFTDKDVGKHNQVKYLLRYLSQPALNCTFMIMEHEYISNDYLFDYGAYYSTCFKDYKKKCNRVHFFSNPDRMDTNKFDELLNRILLLANDDANIEEIKKIQSQYIGSIVIKPLSNSIIGFTILKPEKEARNGDRVEFWGTRPYTNHLHGLPLPLTSLAFQEQDRVLSACATISIWSMLQGAAEDYHVSLKTPGEITMAAGMISESTGSRLFPNNGLTLQEMAKSITSNGLLTEVEIFDPPMGKSKANKTIIRIKELVEAYSQVRIPILLLLEIRESNTYNSGAYNTIHNQNGGELHAVAVCGCSLTLEKNDSKRTDFTKVPNTSYKINALFANDDGYGPFTTITFDSKNGLLNTEWSKSGEDVCVPYCMMIPVYPLIRIPLEGIESLIEKIDILLNLINKKLYIVCEIEYKIRVMPSEVFKLEVKNGGEYNPDDPAQAQRLRNILYKPLPKYIWIATVYFKFVDQVTIHCPRIIDFVFDATGFPSSLLSEDELFYDLLYQDEFYNFNWMLCDQMSKSSPVFKNQISIGYYYLKYWADKSKLSAK